MFRSLLFTQGALGTSISAHEYERHSKPDQCSSETFTSSQEGLGHSLAQEALVYSPYASGDYWFSQFSEGTIGTSPSTQGARVTLSSAQKSPGISIPF